MASVSWQLVINDQDGTPVTTIDEQTNPQPIIGAVNCVVTPPGIPEEMTFEGINSILQISPGFILQYREDYGSGYVNIFWGPVIVCPALESQGAGSADEDADALNRFSVSGGSHLVAKSDVGNRVIIGKATPGGNPNASATIGDVAFQFCSDYAHPALTVLSANFTTASSPTEEGGLYYAPGSKLSDYLDKLVNAMPNNGGIWYVDAAGVVRVEEL